MIKAYRKTDIQILDQTHSGIVLAVGIREAWADLFAINVNAHQLTKTELSEN